VGGHVFAARDLINNLFFMSGTIIISVSINNVRHRLIRREFYLRSELQKATAALWGEMEIATKIQTSLLPKLDNLNGYQLGAVMQPATEIGGDYYDAFETEAGEYWAMIGDVSGHGVESGLIMMMAQTSIFSLVNKTRGYPPSRLIDHVNSVIRKNIKKLDSNRYMTLFAIKLGPQSISLAGKHQDLLIHRAATGAVEVIPVAGTWIGLTDEIQDHLEDIDIPLGIGDTLLLFTDGVTEAMDASGNLLGQDRLTALFTQYAGLPPRDLVQRLLGAVQEFQDSQTDDITLVALKRAN
jgi:serine phosphatase RsbU (regulator of sigma subunit)